MSLLPITATLLASLSVHAGLEGPMTTQGLVPTTGEVRTAQALARPTFSGLSPLVTTWFEAGTTGVALELSQMGRTTRWRWVDPRAAEEAQQGSTQEQPAQDKKKKGDKAAKKDKSSSSSSSSGSSSGRNSRWGSNGRDGTPADPAPPAEAEAVPGAPGGAEPDSTSPPVIEPEEVAPTPDVIEEGGSDPIIEEPPAEDPPAVDPEPDPTPDPDPALPPAPAPEFSASFDSAGFASLHEISSGRGVITPNQMPLWKPDRNVPDDQSLVPTMMFTPKDNGFDIEYVFHNTTNEEKRVGDFQVGGIRFGRQVYTREFHFTGAERMLDHHNQNYYEGGDDYPAAYYSPVCVVREGNTVIGAALAYDVPNYKHNVKVRLESPGGLYSHSGRNWQFLFRANPEDRYSEEGNIKPGETRTYRLTVRALNLKPSDHENEWLRTLVPYRDFHRQIYGRVRYQRDDRPVWASEIAATSEIAPDNPMGWVLPQFRPDINGWGPWADKLRGVRDLGFRRILLICAGGVYKDNPVNNFPYQITSTWQQFPPMTDTLDELTGLPTELGIDLGFWWGRSAQVMRTWDTPDYEIMDVDNPEHVQCGMQEVDGVIAANATMLGLDTFAWMPVWDSYRWLEMMLERRPGMKFIAEPATNDIIHTLAGTYTYGLWETENGLEIIDGPPLMADFMHPGHEAWARVNGDAIRRAHGLAPLDDIPDELTRMYMRQVADRGWVPVVHDNPVLTTSINAVRTWETTIPADLQY